MTKCAICDLEVGDITKHVLEEHAVSKGLKCYICGAYVYDLMEHFGEVHGKPEGIPVPKKPEVGDIISKLDAWGYEPFRGVDYFDLMGKGVKPGITRTIRIYELGLNILKMDEEIKLRTRDGIEILIDKYGLIKIATPSFEYTEHA